MSVYYNLRKKMPLNLEFELETGINSMLRYLCYFNTRVKVTSN